MQDHIYQEILLKHLNEPENDLLTQKVNEMRRLSAEHESYYQEILKIWKNSADTGTLFQLDQKLSLKNFKDKLTHHVAVPTASGFKWFRNIAAILALTLLSFWFYTEKTTVDFDRRSVTFHLC